MFVLFADSYEHAGMMPINTIVSIPMRSLVVFGQRDEGGSVTLAFNLRRGDIILGLFPGPGVIEAVAGSCPASGRQPGLLARSVKAQSMPAWQPRPRRFRPRNWYY